jgi:hypothetical protein
MLYYYNKYQDNWYVSAPYSNPVENHNSVDTAEFLLDGWTTYSSYTFSPTPGYQGSGTISDVPTLWASIGPGASCFVIQNTQAWGRMVEKWILRSRRWDPTYSNGVGGYWTTIDAYHWWASATGTTYHQKGTLVQSNIIAEDGTYPNDGVAPDGYWYVKGAVSWVPPDMTFKMGTPYKYEDGVFKMDDKIYRIDAVWTKMNDQIYKL